MGKRIRSERSTGAIKSEEEPLTAARPLGCNRKHRHDSVAHHDVRLSVSSPSSRWSDLSWAGRGRFDGSRRGREEGEVVGLSELQRNDRALAPPRHHQKRADGVRRRSHALAHSFKQHASYLLAACRFTSYGGHRWGGGRHMPKYPLRTSTIGRTRPITWKQKARIARHIFGSRATVDVTTSLAANDGTAVRLRGRDRCTQCNACVAPPSRALTKVARCSAGGSLMMHVSWATLVKSASLTHARVPPMSWRQATG